MAQIPGPACLIDVRIDVLAIKWLADPIGACSSSSILAVMLAACPPPCPSLSARVRGVHEGFGIAGGISAVGDKSLGCCSSPHVKLVSVRKAEPSTTRF